MIRPKGEFFFSSLLRSLFATVGAIVGTCSVQAQSSWPEKSVNCSECVGGRLRRRFCTHHRQRLSERPNFCRDRLSKS